MSFEANNGIKFTNASAEGPSTTDMMAYLTLAEKEKALSERYISEKNLILENFLSWTEQDQTDFTKTILQKMCHHQHSQIDQYLKPMLQRNFITLLPNGLAEQVLSLLDAKSLCASACVSKAWRRSIAHGMLWRKLIERKVRTDSMWRGLSEKRGWKKYLFISKEQATYLIAMARNASKAEAEKLQRSHPDPHEFQHLFYRELYPQIVRDIVMIENNWRQGNNRLQRINCESDNSKGVYCLQYDDEKVISGLRDNTIKIWRRSDLSCSQTLTGHTGSVLCLQYDDQIIASGSSDATVRIWDVKTGAQLNTLIHHCEAVLHLRFQNGMLVTCSKDRSIAVWDMVSPQEINMRRVLVGHRAAVNVVDFDQTYIVSASGDRTIKVWSADTCEFVRTLNGHRRGIACLQYRERLIVSGSSDYSIRLWDIECGNCLRVLEGHEELVRCIRFDSKRIVSGAYDGKIKVWDLQAALDPRTPPSSICIKTLSEHTGRVFRLQFDEFQIVSSSHDDTILIWDFLNTGMSSPVFQPSLGGSGGPPPPPQIMIGSAGDSSLNMPNPYHQPMIMPPHQCVPGSSHGRNGNSGAPGPSNGLAGSSMIGLNMPNMTSSSSLVLGGVGAAFHDDGDAMMDANEVFINHQQQQPFGGAVGGFRSQSLGQISQSHSQHHQQSVDQAPRYPKNDVFQQQFQQPSHVLNLAARPSSSGYQAQVKSPYHHPQQSLPKLFAVQPSSMERQNGGLSSEDSEQEGIVMSVAAAAVGGNSSRGSGEDMMIVDEQNRALDLKPSTSGASSSQHQQQRNRPTTMPTNPQIKKPKKNRKTNDDDKNNDDDDDFMNPI